MINISGRISSVCAVDKECRVQDKDVGSFPMTCSSAEGVTRIIVMTGKKRDALSRLQRRLIYQFTYIF